MIEKIYYFIARRPEAWTLLSQEIQWLSDFTKDPQMVLSMSLLEPLPYIGLDHK